MIRAGFVIISLLACATAPAPSPVPAAPAPPPDVSAVPAPPTLTGHRLVERGELGPTHPELRPYMHQVPLLRISRHGEVEDGSGSFDLVVFADGHAFFEGEARVAEIGFRTQLLGGEERLALIDELEASCPTLTAGVQCAARTVLSMRCSLRAGDFVGRDGCRDDARDHSTLAAAMRAVKTAGLEKWAARDPSGKARYRGSEINAAASPMPWKKYVPASEAPAPAPVPEGWCRGVKPPAVVGAPYVLGVGPDDVRAIVAKMRGYTDRPVKSVSQRDGVVRAAVECCVTRNRDDCGILIVQFAKQNGVWTTVGSRQLPGE